MPRRTVTIEPALDQLLNFVRGLLLLLGQEYNYTEAVNGAIYYGVCYWLNIPKAKAIAMAPQMLTTNLKVEGIQDELRDRFYKNILPKLQQPAE